MSDVRESGAVEPEGQPTDAFEIWARRARDELRREAPPGGADRIVQRRSLQLRRRAALGGGAALVVLIGALVWSASGLGSRQPGSPSVPSPGTPHTGSVVTRSAHPRTGPTTAYFSNADTGVPSFISPEEGWVLASTAAGDWPPTVLHTTDGGQSWSSVGEVRIGAKYLDLPAPLLFATPSDGWIVGGGLYSTHDGGRTWTHTSTDAWAVAAADGYVFALVPSGQHWTVLASPVDHDEFERVTAKDFLASAEFRHVISDTGEPLPQVVVGRDGALTVGGRWDGERWLPWTPACGDSGGDVLLAANPSSEELAYACVLDGPPTTQEGMVRVYVSHDHGRSFAATTAAPPTSAGATVTSIALAGTGQLLLSWTAGTNSTLVASTNDGRSWEVRSTSTGQESVAPKFGNPMAGDFRDLRFTTADDGSARVGDAVAVTQDGGRHWTFVLT